MKIKTIVSALAILVSLASLVQAHDGRRLDVVIIDGQLYAQGYLAGAAPVDDGGGLIRPYYNAIHGHLDVQAAASLYLATLPGFDLSASAGAQLLGADLQLELLSVTKWESPVVGQTPMLEALDASELISVGHSNQSTISSNNLGSFTLADSISGGISDIDLAYTLSGDPTDKLFALEWQLSTNQVGIADSESLYTILSPPGTGPVERLHFQSLGLESQLGITVAVPESSSLMLLAMAGVVGLVRRRK